jgi:anti-sigma regulatory factor (Ser/Thr protein kinase)
VSLSLSLFGAGRARDGGAATLLGPQVPLIEELGWYGVADLGEVAVAERAAAEAGVWLGLGAARAAELASVVAELGRNLAGHATGGRIALRCLRRAGVAGVEVVAIDTGPGMARFPDGTAGGGLGVLSLASRFDGYSLPGRGTAVTAQFWPRGVYPGSLTATGLSRPMPGEPVGGDRFAIRLTGDIALIMIVDGLGHGPLAAVAAAAAVEAFETASTGEPAELVEEIHQRIGHTRGAAVAVARLEPLIGVVRFSGLGNIAAALITPVGTTGTEAGGGFRRAGLVSQPGVAGHQRRTVGEFIHPVGPDGMVVLHTDGVTDRWDLAAYPGLDRRDALVVAATLMRDAGVRRDDACVVVAKLG